MKMHVTVATAQKTLFCGEADEISIPTVEGEIKILSGHAEYLAQVGNGKLKIRAGNQSVLAETTCGLVYNHKNEVSVVLFEVCILNVK